MRAGEIVGIYGLMGAGRTELFECLLGTQRDYPGKVWPDSKPAPQHLTTADRIKMGMSLVPEDRKRTGIFPGSPAGGSQRWQSNLMGCSSGRLDSGGWRG